MSKSQFVQIRDIVQLWIECGTDGHRDSIPVGHFSTEDAIAKFFHDHTHLTSSPAGMREDIEELTKLLRRLATVEVMQIAQIAARRGLYVGFEIRLAGPADEV
jgi:hypothetical protein